MEAALLNTLHEWLWLSQLVGEGGQKQMPHSLEEAVLPIIKGTDAKMTKNRQNTEEKNGQISMEYYSGSFSIKVHQTFVSIGANLYKDGA